VLELNQHAIRGLLPGRTYLLLIEPEESVRRLSDPSDRIEREDPHFRRRVAAAYAELAETFPERITTIDGMRPPEEIGRLILDELREHS
jgi:thymidylate kinase